MALLDDSRANALPELDEDALQAGIGRASAGRDRARALMQRQEVNRRAATGSKRGIRGMANALSTDQAGWCSANSDGALRRRRCLAG